MSQLRPIKGYPGYMVTSDGRVWSDKQSGRWLKLDRKPNGYLAAGLWRDGRKSSVLVHSLVLETFGSPRPEGLQVRHLNGQQRDNRIENLAWGTAVENAADRDQQGNHRNGRKTHCKRGHALSGDNLWINRRTGARQCRACFKIRRK